MTIVRKATWKNKLKKNEYFQNCDKIQKKWELNKPQLLISKTRKNDINEIQGDDEFLEKISIDSENVKNRNGNDDNNNHSSIRNDNNDNNDNNIKNYNDNNNNNNDNDINYNNYINEDNDDNKDNNDDDNHYNNDNDIRNLDKEIKQEKSISFSVIINNKINENELKNPNGVYLFKDRKTILNYFQPNFFPPYNTKEKRKIIEKVLSRTWDEKKLFWSNN